MYLCDKMRTTMKRLSTGFENRLMSCFKTLKITYEAIAAKH